MMMEDSERFDLAFDYAWVDFNSKLYDETKQLVKKLWDGPLDSGKFFFHQTVFSYKHYNSFIMKTIKTPGLSGRGIGGDTHEKVRAHSSTKCAGCVASRILIGYL